jgi:hypothetical protein
MFSLKQSGFPEFSLLIYYPMSFTNTTKTTFHSLMRECDKNDHIGHYDRVSITEFMHDNGYVLIKHNSTPAKLNWRFTLPLFILWLILIIIFMPIKWIFTGNFYYNYENNLMVTHRKWLTNLGI